MIALGASADARWLASSGRDGRVHLWDLSTGKLRDTISLSGRADLASALCWSPSGDELLVGLTRGVVLRFAVDFGG